MNSSNRNIDDATVDGFGREWSTYDQTALDEAEHQELFNRYFSLFPFDSLSPDAEGFDLGCGSGRWAAKMVDRVGTLHCIDPSPAALGVAKRRLGSSSGARFHLAGVDEIPLPDSSQDFGYALGVLHHVPDTQAAMSDCVRKLKPGAPFLVYLYYDLEDRPFWFRSVWKVSDLGRRVICRMPFSVRRALTTAIALVVYWPLARFARLMKRVGFDAGNIPLSAYRDSSLYSMRTDALDRFGTRLEQRFSREQIAQMVYRAGLKDIVFREEEPYWVACGRRGN